MVAHNIWVDPNSEVQQSFRLGKSQNYISGIRVNNNDKYCYIKALGEGNFEKGYQIYITKRNTIVDEFLELFNELEDRRQASAFARWYGYDKFRFIKLGTRLLRFNPVWRTIRELELMLPSMEKFIHLHPKKIKIKGKEK